MLDIILKLIKMISKAFEETLSINMMDMSYKNDLSGYKNKWRI